MTLPRLHLSAVAAAAIYAASALNSPAALLVYEPFNYGTTPGPGEDQNGDGKKDVTGLNGGFGWGGAWVEKNANAVPSPTLGYPLDYINGVSLSEPAGDARFSLGGSAYIYGLGTTNQTTASLTRMFAEPISAVAGSSLWFSILLRKEAASANPTADRVEIGLIDQNENLVGITDPSDSTSFALISPWSVTGNPVSLEGQGPMLGRTDLLVVKLSLATGNSRLELFFNPALDVLPTVPDATMSLLDGTMTDFVGFQVFSPGSRPAWSLDEIRIGETFNDVVPEPSSCLLMAFGLATVGLSRFRRTRIAQN